MRGSFVKEFPPTIVGRTGISGVKWSSSAKQISQADHVQMSFKQNLAVGGALGTSLWREYAQESNMVEPPFIQ